MREFHLLHFKFVFLLPAECSKVVREKEEEEMLFIQRFGYECAPACPPPLVFIVPYQGFQMVPEHSIQIQVNKKY